MTDETEELRTDGEPHDWKFKGYQGSAAVLNDRSHKVVQRRMFEV
jgi:hypothetical protein